MTDTATHSSIPSPTSLLTRDPFIKAHSSHSLFYIRRHAGFEMYRDVIVKKKRQRGAR
jgi:hypothetical protein